jgi:hypothetical protein
MEAMSEVVEAEETKERPFPFWTCKKCKQGRKRKKFGLTGGNDLRLG